MDDVISRSDAIDSIMEEPSEARYPVYYAEKIRQLPSTHTLSGVDLQELEDRFGRFVRWIVEDMLSWKGERWKKEI